MDGLERHVESLHVTADDLGGNEAAAAPSAPSHISLVHPVVMTTFKSPVPDPLLVKVIIKPSALETYMKLVQEMRNEKVYDTSKAKKGKAFIIAVTKSTNMDPLPGYDVDRKLLSRLWDEIGFDVIIPQGGSADGLTSLEIRIALEQFSQMLEDSDQMAVVCIMSHGNNGVIYGRDGNSVPVDDIITYLDSENCIKMASKPKLCVIQACRGGRFDRGVDVRTGYETAAGVESYKVPSKSDMLTCYSVLRGDISFANHNDGSIYIQKFIKAVSEGAATEELHHIMIQVNESMSKTGTPYPQTNKTYEEVFCQMPSFESSLTRKLYLLPCYGGKQGADWRIPFWLDPQLRKLTTWSLDHVINAVVVDEKRHLVYVGHVHTKPDFTGEPITVYTFSGKGVNRIKDNCTYPPVAIDTKRDLILCAAVDRVRTFTTEGELVRTITCPEIKYLVDICYQVFEDRYVVADDESHCLHFICANTGKVLKSVPAEEARLAKVRHDMTDGRRNVYMAASKSPHSSRLVKTDFDKHLINLCDGDGNFIRSYTGEGSETGHFLRPTGVCFDHQDRILVCDAASRRLVRISPDTEDEARSCEVIMNSASLGRGHPRRVDVTMDGLLVMAFYGNPSKGPFNIAVYTGYK